MTSRDCPAIILHMPQLGENIGAAARVMLNFGLTDLRLVQPRDGWPSASAEAMSAGALAQGVRVEVFQTLEEAVADRGFLIATTARPRGMEKPVIGPVEAAGQLQSRPQAAVLFGGEKSGLPNEAVALCDLILTYPVNPAFSSLNLAQAVGVFCHQWGASAGHGGKFDGRSEGVGDPALRSELIAMFEHFERELEAAGYFYPPEKTPVMVTNLRNALVRANWTQQEVRTFRGAIKALAHGRGKARIPRGS